MASRWNRIIASNSLDIRALGMFRIVLGLILVVKFFGTVPRNFEHVFSPTTGLLGNCFAEGYQSAYMTATPLFALRSGASMWAFTLMTGAVMLLFTVGFYPRVMAVVGSVLLWLFHDRYQMLWFGWEQYAQVLFFLCIFLPIGERYSFFRPRQAPERSENSVRGPFVFLMLFQIGFLYFFNGLSKNGGKWMDGTAVQFALGAVERQSPAGEWLLQQDVLAAVITYGTLVWEMGLVFLLFMPFQRSTVVGAGHRPAPLTIRTLVALSIPAFHWGLSLFMDVGDFKYVSLAVGVLLLPGSVWERLPVRFQAMSQRGFRLPSLAVILPRLVPIVIAGLLVGCIIGANLKNSFRSKTDDRLKAWLGGGAIERLVDTVMPDGLPRFSFFTQHWHLFSPNPPSEQGYIRIELRRLDGTVVPVFAGEEGVDRYPTKTLRFLMQYLSYDRKNAKADVLAGCLASREGYRWIQAHPGQMAQNLVVALYTWRPETLAELKAGPEGRMQRVELISMRFRTEE